jgi:hypothetical protein
VECGFYLTAFLLKKLIDSIEEQSRGQQFEAFYAKEGGEAIVTESKEPQGIKLENTGVVEEKEMKIPTGPRASRGDAQERVEVRGGQKVRVVGPNEL